MECPLKEIDASSPSSPGGIDLDKAAQAINVLTETLNASCLQSTRIIELATGKSPVAYDLGNLHTIM
jgi:hypothetical protein